MDIGDYIFFGLFVVFGLIGGYVVYDQNVNIHSVCYEEGIVLDILSVSYRDALILTDKGKMVLNQATVKDGDTICLRSGRERINEDSKKIE